MLIFSYLFQRRCSCRVAFAPWGVFESTKNIIPMMAINATKANIDLSVEIAIMAAKMAKTMQIM